MQWIACWRPLKACGRIVLRRGWRLFSVPISWVPICLVPIGLTLAAPGPAASQGLSDLEADRPYAQVRQKLLANGWEMVTVQGRDCTKAPVAHRAACRSFPEFDGCNEEDRCSFYWMNDQKNYLVIFTSGRNYMITGFSYPTLYLGPDF
jgi:hypothetical protein